MKMIFQKLRGFVPGPLLQERIRTSLRTSAGASFSPRLFAPNRATQTPNQERVVLRASAGMASFFPPNRDTQTLKPNDFHVAAKPSSCFSRLLSLMIPPKFSHTHLAPTPSLIASPCLDSAMLHRMKFVLPRRIKVLLTDIQSKFKGKCEHIQIVPIRCHGTLTMVVRGPGIDGVFLVSDGLLWEEQADGTFRPFFDGDEKVIKINNWVICATGGSSFLADLIIMELQGTDLDCNGCAVFAEKYMKNFFWKILFKIFSFSLNELRELWDLFFWTGYKELCEFYIVFASAAEKETQLSIYSGYSGGQIVVDNPLPFGETIGMCAEIVEQTFKKSLSAGNSVEFSIALSLAHGYKNSTEEEAIGGKMTIMQVNSEGIFIIWKGHIKDMLMKYDIQV